MHFFLGAKLVLLLAGLVYSLDNGLARTPPMGWSSWNTFACNVSEALIMETADALVSSGLRDVGYVYVNIDDCWCKRERNATTGDMVVDDVKFPHGMKFLADYLHARGLKFGLYSAAGVYTCQGYPGTYKHEKQDAALFASWEIDYFKQDWCFFSIGEDPKVYYPLMRDALNATGRPVVYSICEYGLEDPWIWGPDVGNLWRTTNDINDNWSRWTYILERQADLAKYSGPGAWNDMDMLVVGMGRQTDAMYRAHFSLWALLNSPLIAGNDVRHLTPATLEILANKEVIAINQDPLGIEAVRVFKSFLGDQEVWARPLSGGDYAAVLFNRDESKERSITLTFAALPSSPARSAPPARAHVRDLWRHQDLGVAETSFTVSVPSAACVMVRLTPA